MMDDFVFYQPKIVDMFLIFPLMHMWLLLIISVLARASNEFKLELYGPVNTV